MVLKNDRKKRIVLSAIITLLSIINIYIVFIFYHDGLFSIMENSRDLLILENSCEIFLRKANLLKSRDAKLQV